MSTAVNINYYLDNQGAGSFKVRGTQQVDVSRQSFLLVPDALGLHKITPYTEPASQLKRDPDSRDLGPKFTTRPEGTMFRIIAARDIYDTEDVFVEEGDEGGLICNPDALSQRGHCWVERDAKIIGGVVRDDAQISDDAVVSGGMVFGNASVGDNARVEGGNIFGNAVITDNAIVRGGNVFDQAVFSGTAVVAGGQYSGKFEADSGRFGEDRYRGPELSVGRIRVCDDDDDDDDDYDSNDWLAEIFQSSHLLAIPTRFGTLTVYRTRHKNTAELGYRLQVGCQRRRLHELANLADTHSANATERAMIPGFVDMASALVQSWGVEL